MELYKYKCFITNVVDGDTVDAIIDLGFSIQAKHRLRLLGVDTPELRDKDEATRLKAQEAKTFVTETLLNKEFVVKTEKSDSFGRYLAIIYLDDTKTLNDLLIEKGYAEVFK